MFTLEKLKNPDNKYSIVPFWFWNDDLQDENLTEQMYLMKEQNISEVVISPRVGLTVKYLSEEWFSKVGLVIQLANELDMKVWIYDEENFPSGYAGGRVIDKSSDFCGKNLRMIKLIPGQILQDEDCRLVAVFEVENNTYIRRDLTKIFDLEKTLYIFVQKFTKWKAAYCNDLYIDVLNIDATKEFISSTHIEYEKRFGKYFGNIIKGFFTDEAGFYNNLKLAPWSDANDNDTVVWTDKFPEFFTKLYDYNVLDYLPYLWVYNETFSPRVRRDFYEATCDMYKQNFLYPQKNYIESKGMRFIGHLHCEDYLHLHIAAEGNFTKALEGLSYAGTDRIDLNAIKINEKLVSSMGHQYDKERVMSESFAQSGWSFNFSQIKKWTNYQYVRGINMLVPHAFFSSIEGNRKFDCPPSFFYQNPYYKHFHLYAKYVKRLSYLLSEGIHKCDIALYFPISSAQAEFNPVDSSNTKQLDMFVQNVALQLLDNQYDFDFITDEALNNIEIQSKNFKINKESYKVVIIPAAKYMPLHTIERLNELAKMNIPVIFISGYPKCCCDERKQVEFDKVICELMLNEYSSDVEERLIYRAYTYVFNVESLENMAIFKNAFKPDFKLQYADDNIKYMMRTDGNKSIYFIVNEDDVFRKNTAILNQSTDPVIWNLEKGEQEFCQSTIKNDGVYCDIVLPPNSSMIVVFGAENPLPEKIEKSFNKIIKLNDKWDIDINGKRFNDQLKTWSEWGFGDFSGECVYTQNITLDEECISTEILISIEEVHDICEVYVNKKLAGVRIWEPFEVSSTNFIRGDNEIKIVVINSLSNSLENRQLKSGLFGNVKLYL